MKRNVSPKLLLTTKAVAYGAVSTAAVMVSTLLGFSSAQFYFNVGDAVSLIVSALFGPFIGMIAGGLGSVLADLAVYPATMLFTLVIKGIEGLLAGTLLYIIRKKVTSQKGTYILSFFALAIPAYCMMAGYFLCQSLFYGTYASAIVALPADAVQASISFILAFVALFPAKLIRFREKVAFDIFEKKIEKDSDKDSSDTLSEK